MSSLIDLINQLITEHGSAPIQDKRISQIKEYVTLLEKKHSLLQGEAGVMKAENDALKAEKIDLQKKVSDLEKALYSLENQPHDNISDEQLMVLKAIVKVGTVEEKIVSELGRHAESVCFDLDELVLAGLVERKQLMGISFSEITHKGRKLLKEKGII
jgi:hypothetical protein